MWTAFVLCSGGVNAEVYDNVLASIVNYSTGRKELESLHNLLSVRVLFRRSSLASQIGGVWESPVFLGAVGGALFSPWFVSFSFLFATNRILLETWMSKLSMLMMLKKWFFFRWILTIVELINLNGSISQMLTCCQCCCYCHCCHFKNVVFHTYALNVPPLLVYLWGKRSSIHKKYRYISLQ